MLEGQLDALGRDIRSARSALGRPAGSVRDIVGRRRGAPRRTARGERVRLPKGQEIRIRPIEPGDAPLLRATFEGMSAMTRYKRFLAALDRLSERQLRYLTTVDHADHEALVACDAGSGAGIGVARYVRDAHDHDLAEVAVVVTDAWQRRGVASALLERLARAARAAGIERLIAVSVAHDRAAVALAAHAGTVMERRGGPGTTELRVRLPDLAAPAALVSELTPGLDHRRGFARGPRPFSNRLAIRGVR
jgi:GNAT superfamily N-acetyltransferase